VGAAVRYPDAPTEELRSAVRIDWQAMTSWFEEDVEVFTHPRSPYTRVDVLPSSRRVQVLVDGVEVADSTSPRILFETGLPPRYYLPKPDVRMDLLTPSDRVSHCPYKGQAEYWTIDTGKRKVNGAAWGYRYPLPESAGVAGLVCFLDERVDIMIDGVQQERPKSPFS
jgi:uncharacterized protein (DUF427 family)